MLASELFRQMREESPSFRALQREHKPELALALNVNRLRNAKGMTQEELARLAGMRQPRIAEIERGDANPRLDTIKRLAQVLGEAPGDLITLWQPHPYSETPYKIREPRSEKRVARFRRRVPRPARGESRVAVGD